MNILVTAFILIGVLFLSVAGYIYWSAWKLIKEEEDRKIKYLNRGK